jgi:hypothetical protein
MGTWSYRGWFEGGRQRPISKGWQIVVEIPVYGLGKGDEDHHLFRSDMSLDLLVWRFPPPTLGLVYSTSSR